jgi:hypothetical protein
MAASPPNQGSARRPWLVAPPAMAGSITTNCKQQRCAPIAATAHTVGSSAARLSPSFTAPPCTARTIGGLAPGRRSSAVHRHSQHRAWACITAAPFLQQRRAQRLWLAGRMARLTARSSADADALLRSPPPPLLGDPPPHFSKIRRPPLHHGGSSSSVRLAARSMEAMASWCVSASRKGIDSLEGVEEEDA